MFTLQSFAFWPLQVMSTQAAAGISLSTLAPVYSSVTDFSGNRRGGEGEAATRSWAWGLTRLLSLGSACSKVFMGDPCRGESDDAGESGHGRAWMGPPRPGHFRSRLMMSLYFFSMTCRFFLKELVSSSPRVNSLSRKWMFWSFS